MPITQQRIESINFTKLKSLKNVEIAFSDKPLTAIMGVNGAGKSTILHALACCYKPEEGSDRKDYKFSEFFLPNTFALWNDSEFTINYSYRDGRKEYVDVKRQYQKKERWTPRYVNRPERYVSYLGITSCVPDIESDSAKSFVSLTFNQQTDSVSNSILQACKYILNIPYEQLAICKNANKKEYLGVTRVHIGKCTSLSMGAGEQRVFKIIKEAYSCPKYALLLIDEIDLLLHENALKRLIQKLYEIAVARKLQIVFTTHSMLMAELEEYVGIRYLRQTATKTLVQTSISTDSVFQLTGNVQRPIQIYVEDSLSQTIINRICDELGCKRYVKVFRFGAAINSFTIIAGKVLNGECIEKTLAVMDGDVYCEESDRLNRIKQIITGDQPLDETRRQNALKSISMYHLPAAHSPEMFIRNSILAAEYEVVSETDELRIVLEEIGVVDNNHKYVDDAISRLDIEYCVGLEKVVNCFSKTEEWNDFIAPVKIWLSEKLSSLRSCAVIS